MKRKHNKFQWLQGLALPSALLALAVLGTACGSPSEGSETAQESEPIQKKVERGPVTVVSSVDKDKLTIAEQLTFSLEITADENYEVEFPRFGDSLEQFGIVDHSTQQPTLIENDRVRQSRTYRLEPFLSGEYTIPPLKVVFWSDEAPEDKHTLETEEINIQVDSLLPDDLAELTIHEIGPPVDLPQQKRNGLMVFVILTLAAAAILWLASRKKRAPSKEESPIPAHEIAYQALEKLIDDRLAEQGLYKQFYQRVSLTLRQYIEYRFGLRAPELTTEEFLQVMGTSPGLGAEHKKLLRDFLKFCDLVKFAECQPETRDIQNTFDTCKRFIGETTEDQPKPTKSQNPSDSLTHPSPATPIAKETENAL